MAETHDQDELALKRRTVDIAQAKIGFYRHLGTYSLVNLFLLLLNLLTSPGNLWFHWALLGWGVGLVAHAFSVCMKGAGDSWLRPIKQRELDRMRQEHDRSIGL